MALVLGRNRACDVKGRALREELGTDCRDGAPAVESAGDALGSWHGRATGARGPEIPGEGQSGLTAGSPARATAGPALSTRTACTVSMGGGIARNDLAAGRADPVGPWPPSNQLPPQEPLDTGAGARGRSWVGTGSGDHGRGAGVGGESSVLPTSDPSA